MLTSKDTKKLIEAFKEILATRDELSVAVMDLKTEFNNLQTTVDCCLKNIGRHNDEIQILNYRVHNPEDK